MKRSGFKPARPPRPATQTTYTPRARAPAPAAAPDLRPVAAVAKDGAIQHRGYMALVRALPCARCGRPGPSQFCHADILGTGGKGMGLKSDCRLGWPGCGPHDGLTGCHWVVGTSGVYSKEQRHEFESAAGRRTRATIIELGLWPGRMGLWPIDAQARNVP